MSAALEAYGATGQPVVFTDLTARAQAVHVL